MTWPQPIITLSGEESNSQNAPILERERSGTSDYALFLHFLVVLLAIIFFVCVGQGEGKRTAHRS